jgi:hypothetical protein
VRQWVDLLTRQLVSIARLLDHYLLRLLWVIRVVLTARPSLPVYPDERTSSEPVGMSERCHERKWPTSFDHLVGAGEQ